MSIIHPKLKSVKGNPRHFLLTWGQRVALPLGSAAALAAGYRTEHEALGPHKHPPPFFTKCLLHLVVFFTLTPKDIPGNPSRPPKPFPPKAKLLEKGSAKVNSKSEAFGSFWEKFLTGNYILDKKVIFAFGLTVRPEHVMLSAS